MSYAASISVEGDAENIIKLFQAEEKNFKNNRSRYEVEQKENKVVFKIFANDATALRSTLDSVAKGLKIYEDMK